LWRGKVLSGRIISPLKVSREGASHCARGGRAPIFNCIVTFWTSQRDRILT
jgi:hypothetical protein